VLFDSHNHLQRLPAPTADEILARAEGASVAAMMCCATGAPGDWDALEAFAKRHPETVRVSFGLHPWHIASADRNWRKTLEHLLDAVPAGLGEIGLDRSPLCRTPVPTQMDAFLWQLNLARDRGLPATIHCTGAWDLLWEVMKARPPQPILLHSFKAPPEIVKALTSRGVHLSIGPSILPAPVAKTAAMLAAIPEGMLHVESDFEGPWPPVRRAMEPAGIGAVTSLAAQLLGRDASALEQSTYEASEAFFSFPRPA